VFTKLMVPVDVTHPGQLEKALAVAADLARHYGAGICYVAVTSSAPNALGHTPEEAARHLDEFAAAQGETHGLGTSGHLVVSHDPAVDLDKSLLGAIRDTGADLVVVASHVPGWRDLFSGSHGGWLARHAPVSVTVVRDA